MFVLFWHKVNIDNFGVFLWFVFPGRLFVEDSIHDEFVAKTVSCVPIIYNLFLRTNNPKCAFAIPDARIKQTVSPRLFTSLTKRVFQFLSYVPGCRSQENEDWKSSWSLHRSRSSESQSPFGLFIELRWERRCWGCYPGLWRKTTGSRR